MTDTVQQRVQAGAVLLDQKMPGWHEKIDPGTLDLHSKQQCVLGQLFTESHSMPNWKRYEYASLEQSLAMSGFTDAKELKREREFMETVTCTANYDAGRVILGLNETDTIAHGFNHSGFDNYSEWARLDEAWLDEVKARHNT